jgi:hypothetical protein
MNTALLLSYNLHNEYSFTTVLQPSEAHGGEDIREKGALKQSEKEVES